MSYMRAAEQGNLARVHAMAEQYHSQCTYDYVFTAMSVTYAWTYF